MREALVEAIKMLPEREQYVMSMYYEHDMNLKEIAAVLEGDRVARVPAAQPVDRPPARQAARLLTVLRTANRRRRCDGRWPGPACTLGRSPGRLFIVLRLADAAVRRRRTRRRCARRRCAASRSLRHDALARACFVAAGFPLSLLATGIADGRCRPGPGCCRWACCCVLYPLKSLARRAALPDPDRCAARACAALVPLAPGGAHRSTPAAAWAPDCIELQRAPTRRPVCDGLEWSWPLRLAVRLALPLRDACAAPTSGRPTGRATTWSTCSSGPKAWRARRTRRGANCAPAPGW